MYRDRGFGFMRTGGKGTDSGAEATRNDRMKGTGAEGSKGIIAGGGGTDYLGMVVLAEGDHGFGDIQEGQRSGLKGCDLRFAET